MQAFPTLYRHTGLAIKPNDGGYNVIPTNDPTIRTDMEGGYVVTRARFTRVVYRYHILLSALTTTNKNTVLAFEAARECGSEAFTWTDHAGVTKTVRFLGVVTYTPVQNTNYSLWDLEFDLEEV